jgi:hypothetical protein
VAALTSGRLDSGDREGPICTFLAFSEVFSTFARDPYVFPYLMGSFVLLYHSTVF